MSTRQMGQQLLVHNHWSTQSMWNKCMHGSLLKQKDIETLNETILNVELTSMFSRKKFIKLGRTERKKFASIVKFELLSKIGRG